MAISEVVAAVAETERCDFHAMEKAIQTFYADDITGAIDRGIRVRPKQFLAQ